MPNQLIVDTNIIIRFFTNDPPDQGQKAKSLIEKAIKGDVILHLLPIIVAEVIFTLKSFYKMSHKEIAHHLMSFIQIRGVHLEDKICIINALIKYGNNEAGFVDAYLAAVAAEQKVPVISFDNDFDKFHDIERIQP